MENDRLKQQIEAGAMAQPVEEETVKGLTAQGTNLIPRRKMFHVATNSLTLAALL